MSLLDTADISALLSTTLTDAELETVIDREEAEMVRAYGVFATGVLHLWHPAADRSWLPDNDRRLDDVRAGGRVVAERGMSALRDLAVAVPA